MTTAPILKRGSRRCPPPIARRPPLRAESKSPLERMLSALLAKLVDLITIKVEHVVAKHVNSLDRRLIGGLSHLFLHGPAASDYFDEFEADDEREPSRPPVAPIAKKPRRPATKRPRGPATPSPPPQPDAAAADIPAPDSQQPVASTSAAPEDRG